MIDHENSLGHYKLVPEQSFEFYKRGRWPSSSQSFGAPGVYHAWC